MVIHYKCFWNSKIALSVIIIFWNSTFHLQLSFGMPPICPSMVHSNVIQRSFLDDKCVLLSIFLEAKFGIFVFVKLLILKEPEKKKKHNLPA